MVQIEMAPTVIAPDSQTIFNILMKINKIIIFITIYRINMMNKVSDDILDTIYRFKHNLEFKSVLSELLQARIFTK